MCGGNCMIVIEDFWKEVAKYVALNKDNPFPVPFKYKDTTIIDSDVLASIWKDHCNGTVISDLYEKECDYNRLLRAESKEIKNELQTAQTIIMCQEVAAKQNNNGGGLIDGNKDDGYLS